MKKYLCATSEGRDQCYLPLHTTLRQWSDRKKKVTEPLSGHIYLFISVLMILQGTQHPGYYSLVSFEGKAVKVPESTIEAIKNLIDNKFELEECPINLKKGDRVRIMHGILKGFDGELVIFNNQKRVIIRIEEINKSLLVNLPVHALKLLE
jgi:transcription antitermination factor NusG